MLPHSLGWAVIFISLQHFIAPALDSMPCLQARATRDCNKGIKFKKDINTLLCPSKSNSKPNELTVHTSCYWGLRLILCYMP